MNRRIAGATAALAVAVVSLGACSAAPVSSSETSSASTSGATVESSAPPTADANVSGSVTQWIYPLTTDQQDYWDAKVADFEAQYPKIKVSVVVQPWANRDEQLTTAIAGGGGPDVVYLIPDQIVQYASTGALADVTDLIGSDVSDYTPGSLEGVTVDGKIYGIPVLQSVAGTVINTKAFSDAGISELPQSLDDLLADAPALKKAGYYATQYSGSSNDTLNLSFYPLLWRFGGSVLSDDGTKAAFNDQAGVDALTYVKKLVDGGYVPQEPITTQLPAETNPYAQGKVAAMLSTASSDLTSNGLDKTQWVSVPPLTNDVSVAYGTVGALSELASTKNSEATAVWLKWVTSAENTKDLDLKSTYFSPRPSTGKLYADDPLLGAEEAQVANTKPGLIAVSSRQIMSLISPQVQAALLGQMTPQEALDKAAADVDALLASQ